MKQKGNRREFLRMASLSGAGLVLGGSITSLYANRSATALPVTFLPGNAASWWATLEDILWPEKKVIDRIKRRAENFAKARIDTAINFGFHIRFDFSNYFGQLHGYYANVCEELHKRDIRFMEHYSCNHVERPRGDAQLKELQKGQRHHVLLFHDPIAAKYAQYEGHYFNDLCEVDLRDGCRGYATSYQLEVFCHNNPGFLDMHKKYLLRLMKDVPFDGIEVDDMCDYAGFTTCGCRYCRERLKKDYGHEIPPFGDNYFWGDTTRPDMQSWGNYENPAFRDWLSMKSDSVADHLKMIKTTIGSLPLMTCCSNAGPIVLNSIALNLEKMAPYLDFFMLENVGITVETVNWMKMDAEALYQKDVAEKKGNAPAITISYMICEKGGYLGWCLARFWGVANWSSTLNGRLEEDPADTLEVEDIIGPYNNWNVHNGDLNDALGKDLVEARLVSSSFCRDNGWRGTDGYEQWDRVLAWSALLIKYNIGYRLLRCDELADGKALCEEDTDTPLILDGVACVSDSQFRAIQHFLSKGGKAWLAWPFGTHDEKGVKRNAPLSDEISKGHYKNLVLVHTASASDPLEKLISERKISPLLKQIAGNAQWAVRVRSYKKGLVIHFLNTALIAVPHPTLKDSSGTPILKDFHSDCKNNMLEYELDAHRIPLGQLTIRSPELGDKARPVAIREGKNSKSVIRVNLEGVETYATAQNLT